MRLLAHLILFIVVLHCHVFGISAFSAETSPSSPGQSEAELLYLKEVKSTLHERCFACHGALQQKGGLRLDTAEFIRRGGESGPSVIAGQPDQSELMARVTSTDLSTRMPPEGPALTSEQIDNIRQWISQGAASNPLLDHAEVDPQSHWAFLRPVKAPLPILTGQTSTATANPIDAFVLEKLESAGLSPRPRADKATLLRRVTIDLIGVPPTVDELHAFLADESPGAYQSVVDRLLADPRHGERWARHWMDVWRYADWYGRRYVPDNWNSAPQVWRWRDWIVNSLNEDHGYDRMVCEMLAADELAADDPQATVATGFLIRNWYALNPNDWMRANVEHTSKAFLGLTFHCAHCHDHKYDPITQDDYFRLRAFFEPINIRQDRVPGEADPGPFQEYSYGVLRKVQRLGAIQVFDKSPEAVTWFYTGGDERNRVTDRGTMAPGLPAFLGGGSAKIEPVSLPLSSWNPGTRAEIVDTLIADQQAVITSSEQSLSTARTEIAAALPALQSSLQTAEAEFASARTAAETANQTGVLKDQQSLLVHAATGRRMISNSITSLKTLETGTTISFQVQIVQESHFNFQLAKDFSQGLTASYVGFEKGQIKAYQPGGFNEFTTGAYDLAAGQNHLQVELDLDIPMDRCLLTVRSLSDDKVLVDRTPVALNGWNPIGNPQKGILLDGRPGSVTVFDDLQIRSPANSAGDRVTLVEFQFEAPSYPDQTEIAGRDGWQTSSYCQPPATSLCASTIGNDTLLAASQKVHTARRALAAQELRIPSAEARLAAAKAEIASIQARLQAELARAQSAPELDPLVRAASESFRQAAQLKAQADVLALDLSLATAESKSITDPARSNEIDSANKQLNAARESLKQSSAALTDSAQSTNYHSLGPTYPKTSTGRRRALALWITGRENPLAARVAMNYIWMRHFHSPLVASVFDFGRNGADPTHPELLDWLAVELMESGWSMKHMHRLIVTSDAYKRVSSAGAGSTSRESDVESTQKPAIAAATAFTSDASSAALARNPFQVDPENKLLWRMNPGRMEAEVVRDSLLTVAGSLDLKMGGQELENSESLTTHRRTLYYSCQPELDGKSEFGALFDAPEPTDCYRRTRSVIPQQSLALTNSAFVHDLSVQITQDSLPLDDTSFVNRLFEQILCRAPTPTELSLCLTALHPTSPDLASLSKADAEQHARSSLVRVLLNHNDFITIR